jgi:hypothetical protein
VRAGALGDVLLLRRAIASLGAAGHEVVLLAPARSGTALLGRGPADVAKLIDWERADVASLLRGTPLPPGPLRRELEACAVAVAYSRSDALCDGLGSVVPRVLRHDPRPGGTTHAASWLCAPLAVLGVPVTGTVPFGEPSEAESVAAQPVLDALPPGFLAVHPGSGSPGKNWPAASFAGLVEAHSRDRPWLLVQGPADAEACAPLLAWPGAVLARELPYRVLGTVLGRAGLYVGNDSGVSHLAAAWGAPSLVLFGPTDPAVWAPEGVRFLRSPTGRLADLPLAAVAAAAR